MTSTDNKIRVELEAATGASGDLRSMAADALRILLESSVSPNTRRAYEDDLRDFFGEQGERVVNAAAVELLLAMDAQRLTVTLRAYATTLRKRGLSEATVRRRLSSVKKLIDSARLLGAPTPDPKPLVKAGKTQSYRDTRGPDLSEVARILDTIDRSGAKGKRDYAMLLILTLNGLRRGELLHCRIRDFDRRLGRLRIIGKGRTEGAWIALTPETVAAVWEYLQERQVLEPAGPLWVTYDHRYLHLDERALTGRGFYEVVREYGLEILGRSLNPHALRHTAITEALEQTGGDIPLVQDFSRHARPETVMIYRHAANDGQGRVTELLADSLRKKRQRQDKPPKPE